MSATTSAHKHLEGLTDEQRAAATHIDGPAIVVAGPGAGKTSTSVKRIAHLVRSGINPKRILFTTFSKNAANQQKDRLRQQIGGAAEDVTCSTMHSLGLRILRERKLVGGDGGERFILKSWMQMKFIRDWYYGKGIRRTHKQMRLMLDEITARKRILQTPEGIETGELKDLWTAYEAWKRREGLIEFDDMIWRVVTELADDASLRTMFDYIMVDEYQDVDPPQFRMLELLAAEHGNVFVVGDPRQSIYLFRGSDERVWEKLMDRWPATKVYVLTNNFRSRKYVVDASNFIAASMSLPDRLRSNLVHVRQGDGRIEELARLVQVVERLKAHNEAGIAWRDMAVIARANASLAKYQPLLKNAEIPYIISRKDSIFSRREVATVFAIARVVEDHRDVEALETLLRSQHPWKAFLSGAYVDGFFSDVHEDPVLALGREMGGYDDRAARRAAEIADRVKRNLLYVERATMGMSLQDRLRFIIGQSDTKTMVEDIVANMPDMDRGTSNYDDEVKSRMGVFDDVVELAFQYKHAADMEEDLTEATRDDPNAEDEDAVRLGSVHSAKGLEWDVVFIADCVDGKMPRTTGSVDAGEEQRIAFVAASRAKDHLYLVTDAGVLSPYFEGLVTPPEPEVEKS